MRSPPEWPAKAPEIVILYLDEHEDARETARIVGEEGSEAEIVAGDIGSEQFCRDAIGKAVQRFGRIDILVNNAAEQHTVEGLEELTEEQLVRTFRTNIFSMFFLTKAALPHLERRRPRSSTAARSPPIAATRSSSTMRPPRGRSSPSPARSHSSWRRAGSG